MSHFASALNELIKENDLTQAELSRLAGIAQPQLSRWINAEQVRPGFVNDEDFERLAKVFTKPISQAHLMRARLLDVCSGPKVAGNKLIRIEISGEPNQAECVPYQTKLPPKLDKDIQTIVAELPNDRLVRDMIASLAAHIRRK